MRGLHPALVVLMASMFLGAPCDAEGNPGAAQASAYYISPGFESRLQINVHIWGEVHKPGLYVVPEDTDLITLLSYAGGPTENAELGEVKLVRTLKGSETVHKVDVTHYINEAAVAATIRLEPGDTVVINGSTWHGFGRMLGYLTQVAIVASTANVIFGTD